MLHTDCVAFREWFEQQYFIIPETPSRGSRIKWVALQRHANKHRFAAPTKKELYQQVLHQHWDEIHDFYQRRKAGNVNQRLLFPLFW